MMFWWIFDGCFGPVDGVGWRNRNENQLPDVSSVSGCLSGCFLLS